MLTRNKKVQKFTSLLLAFVLLFSSLNLSVFAKETVKVNVEVIGDGTVTIVDGDNEHVVTNKKSLSKDFFLDSSIQIKLKGEPIKSVQFDGVNVEGIEDGTTEISYQYMISKDTTIKVAFSKKKVEAPIEKPIINTLNESDEPLSPNDVTYTADDITSLYRKGIYNESFQVEYRKQLAKEKGLLEHVDENYFIKESYEETLSSSEIMDQGLIPLMKIMSDDEFDKVSEEIVLANQHDDSKSISVYANPTSLWIENNGNVTHTDINGYPHYQDRLSVSIQVPGDTQSRNYDAFCSCIEMDAPPDGTYTIKSLVKITNLEWRKVLYYGYNQPGSSKLGSFENVTINRPGHYIATAEACSYANGHDHRSFGNRYFEHVKKLPAPPAEWECYKVVTTNSSVQELAFGFMAKPAEGNLKIQKSSAKPTVTNNNSEYSLNGAVYDVYKNSNATGLMGTLRTDSNGNSTTTLKLAPGRYYVKESSAPKGYQLDTKTHQVDITAGQTNTLRVTDEPKMSKFNVNKVSSNKNWTDGNDKYSVEGAVYGIYSDSACTKKITEVTISKNGWSNTIEHAAGTLYAKELRSPNSYHLNPQVYSVYASAGNQATFYVSDDPKASTITLQKTSLKPEYTDGNDCYSLDGAIYGVYSDSTCRTKVSELTTNASGKSNTVTLRAGKYWVKEIKASKGYALDTTIYLVDVNAGDSRTLNVKEKPMNDPVAVVLNKVDAETGNPIPVGDGSLQGAEYTFKFYKGNYASTTDPATLGKSADRTWVFSTDEYGLIYFEDSYKVRGDTLYLNSIGAPTMPLGTVTIQETKAPSGYKLDPTVHVRKITESGTLENVESFKEIIHKEKSVTFEIKKIQKDIHQVISDTVFKVTYPNGSVKQHTTGSDGIVTLKGLNAGHYKVQEVSTKPGLVVNENIYEFDVLDDGTLKPTEIYSDVLSSRNFEHSYDNVNAKGYLTVYNEPVKYAFSVEKSNEDGKQLEGAEFTLYSDSTCQTEISKMTTDVQGHLSFTDLTYRTTYYLKETKAPQGYRIPLDEHKEVHVYPFTLNFNAQKGEVTINVDGKQMTQATTKGNVRFDGTLDQPNVTIDVVNYKTMKLPETGSNEMPYIYFTAAIGMLLGGCIALRQKALKKIRKSK